MLGTQIGQYIIHEQLGRGGMGIVYRATDTKLDRDVALKFLPPDLSRDEDAKARFVLEAKAASALDHPNICTIHEIGESNDGKLFIAMSYYDGQTLKYVLEGGKLPVGRATNIATQIAEGLRKAHDAGIIHRDIKPANIMVTEDGLVKILDFGLAKLGIGADLTKAGSTVGTTSYMSPEQSSGNEVDGRTDIWSLGVILHEMLSGKKTFGGGYDQAVLYSVLNEAAPPLEDILNEAAPPLEDIPELLGEIVDKMLAKDPAQRMGSAQDVLKALDPFASGIRQSSPSLPTAASRSRPAWVIPVAALVVIVLGWMTIRGLGGSEDGNGVLPQQDLVAVLPFAIQGSADMAYLAESMSTLLTTMLDGAGNIKTLDHAAVFEYLKREHGDDPVGPATGVDLANHFGVSNFVLGSIARAGAENRMSARLYSTEGVSLVESTSSYVGDDDFLGAVDLLAAGLMGVLLDDPDQDLSSIAASTTTSFEALKYYLEAEKLVRIGQHQEGYEQIQRSLALDSTFALAWYLRAETQGWIDVIDGSTRSDLLMAKKYSEQLTGRAKRLLDAELVFNEGRGREAARMYEAILRDYPSDIEATGQLAEAIVHYSFSESDHLRALNLFKRVAELVPGSQQFAFHYIDMLAYRGFLTGDYHGLDSLAAVYAGMPIPERGQRLDWSRALDQMSADVAANLAIYAQVRGTPEDSVAAIGQFSNYGSMRLQAYGNPDHTIARARHNGLESEQPYIFESLMIKGQFSKADASDFSPDNRNLAELKQLVEATLPVYEIPEDSLDALEVIIGEWDFDARPHPTFKKDGQLIRTYLLSQLALKRGQETRFRELHDRYLSLRPDSAAHPVWVSISAELNGLRKWLEGDLLGAIVSMQAAKLDNLYFIDFDTVLSVRFQPFWYLASMLEQNGQLEEAIEEYTAVVNQPAAPLGWEKAAALHLQLGNTDQAIKYNDLIIRQWTDADEILQPRVEAARQRQDILLDQLSEEPQ